MSYKTGPSKSLDDITLTDVLAYPIWEWALDEEGVEGQDETWQRPIIDTDDVTDDIFNPTITLKVKDQELIASAEYDSETRSIRAITLWFEERWLIHGQVPALQYPAQFVALPKINGVENVTFRLPNIYSDEATIVKSH